MSIPAQEEVGPGLPKDGLGRGIFKNCAVAYISRRSGGFTISPRWIKEIRYRDYGVNKGWQARLTGDPDRSQKRPGVQWVQCTNLIKIYE